jgi:hypothetical protein
MGLTEVEVMEAGLTGIGWAYATLGEVGRGAGVGVTAVVPVAGGLLVGDDSFVVVFGAVLAGDEGLVLGAALVGDDPLEGVFEAVLAVDEADGAALLSVFKLVALAGGATAAPLLELPPNLLRANSSKSANMMRPIIAAMIQQVLLQTYSSW